MFGVNMLEVKDHNEFLPHHTRSLPEQMSAIKKVSIIAHEHQIQIIQQSDIKKVENVSHQKVSIMAIEHKRIKKVKQIYPFRVKFKPADIHDCCVADHQTSSLLFLMIRRIMTDDEKRDENNDMEDNNEDVDKDGG